MTVLLAKSERYGGGRFVSLREHTEHVIRCAEIIAKWTGLDQATKRTLLLSAALHDIGKAIDDFQKILRFGSYDKDILLKASYHPVISLLLTNISKLEKEHGIDRMLLSTAIALHHAARPDIKKPKETLKVLKEVIEEIRQNNYRVIQTIRENFSLLQIDDIHIAEYIDFNEDLSEMVSNGADSSRSDDDDLSKYISVDLYSYVVTPAEIFIVVAGLLKVADHIASFAERYNVCIDSILLEPLTLAESLTLLEHHFDNRLGVSDAWQKRHIPAGTNKNIILVAPTGSGKTEAALWAGAGKRILFLLPLQSATEQIYYRIRSIVNDDLKRVARLHANAFKYMHYERQNGQSFDEDIDVIMNAARNLAYNYLIATADQVVPAILRYNGYDRIYALMRNAMVVIDEVQAYQPKAIAMALTFALNVNQIKGNFFLMTATMPQYMIRTIGKKIGESNLEIINYYEIEKEKLSRIRKHRVKLITNDNYEYVEQVIDLASKGYRVLVIVNTVPEAQKIYQRIKSKAPDTLKEKVWLLHAKYTFSDRTEKERKLMNEFMNRKKQSTLDTVGKIIVCTQVAEASLDIDADYLFTEIAPIDSIIQRMGRLLRHKTEPDEEVKKPNCFIVVNNKYLNKNPIYDKDIVTLTLMELIKQAGISVCEENIKEIVTNNNIEFTLSEYEKYLLVNSVYDVLMNDERYSNNGFRKDFEEMLELLQAKFRVSEKSTAHEYFREIDNVPVVASNKLDELLGTIENLLQKDYIDYIDFSAAVMDRFIVNIQLKNKPEEDDSEEYDISGASYIRKYIKNMEASSAKLKNKVLRWMEDVRVVYNYEYNSDLGLVRIK